MKMTTSELKKYEKKILKLLLDCCSKDETRLSIMDTVYHDSLSKSLRSTDFFRACLLKSLYDPELKDVGINVNTFSANRREFPRIRIIFDESKVLKMDSIKMEIKDYHASKWNKKETAITYFYKDSTASMNKIDNEFIFALRSDFLLSLVGFTCEIFYKNELTPTYFKLHEETNDFCLIMPYKDKR